MSFLFQRNIQPRAYDMSSMNGHSDHKFQLIQTENFQAIENHDFSSGAVKVFIS